MSLWVRFARRIIIHILASHPDAKVAMPTNHEVEYYKEVIASKYPLLKDCWGAMDGLKILIQKAGSEIEQNNFYNGWKSDHFVTNLFLFAPDGKIKAAYFNAPGAFHDSTLADRGGIYDDIDEVFTRTGGKVVVDSAFASTDSEALIKSHQNIFDNQGNVLQNPSLNQQATSLRQMAEWGMRALQGSFPRLRDRLIYENRGERKLILQSIILLYNYRAAKVGQNQIQSTFMPCLDRDANQVLDGDS